MKSKVFLRDNILSKYGFYCGYRQEYKINWDNYVHLCAENFETSLYSIKGEINGESFWLNAEGLKAARQLYKKMCTKLNKSVKALAV